MSAGRVQSVAVRLICEREREIQAFVPQEYWSIEGQFKTKTNEEFSAELTHVKGDKLDITCEADAVAIKRLLRTIRLLLHLLRKVNEAVNQLRLSPHLHCNKMVFVSLILGLNGP